MTFKELKKFSEWEVKRLDKHFHISDKEKGIFARMTKITEELGELCEAVLSYHSLQRKDKEKLNKSDIEKEIADVLVGVFLLAKQMDIDFEKALEKKIEIIKSRKY
jgi:NTP pyrophosphatase (non-canonical NTP hydrolase)